MIGSIDGKNRSDCSAALRRCASLARSIARITHAPILRAFFCWTAGCTLSFARHSLSFDLVQMRV